MNARKAYVNITYKGSVESKVLNDRVSEFSYSDAATGESDVVVLKVHNVDRLFLENLPQRGDSFSAAINLEDWNQQNTIMTFDCGRFCVDDLSFSGWPLLAEIGGTSIPEKRAFHATARTRTWEYTCISEIAAEICGRYGLAMQYEGLDCYIENVEQTEETDSAFLKKLCEDYGLNVKIYSGSVIIYDAVMYEAKPAARKIKLTDFLDWSYNGTMTEIYTGATIQYSNSQQEEEYEVQIGGGGRLLNCSEKVDNIEAALIKARSKVNKANREEETFSGTLPGDPLLCAAMTFELTDAAGISGKYFIDKISHKIDGGNAYKMNISAHKVQKAVG